MRRWFLPLNALVVIAAACTGVVEPEPTVPVTAARTVPQTTVGAPVTTTTTIPVDPVVAAIQDLILKTEELRGLRFSEPPAYELVNLGTLQKRIAAHVALQLREGSVALDEQLYRLLGVLGEEESLEEIYFSISAQHVTAFYDTEGAVVWIPEPTEEFTVAQRAAIVREMARSLTDQEFSTTDRTLLVAASGSYDESLALESLIEGNAAYVESLFLDSLGEDELAELVASYANVDSSAFNDAPSFVQETLLTPYIDGLAFVLDLVDTKGLDGLDAAFENPPTTTEQVRHPELYRNDSIGREFELDIVLIDGYEVADTSVWGESALIGLFSEVLVSDDVFAAAEGWNGDRFEVLSNGADIVFRLTFFGDSADDDQEFFDAVTDFLEISVSPEAFAEARHAGSSIIVVVSSDPGIGPLVFDQMDF